MTFLDFISDPKEGDLDDCFPVYHRPGHCLGHFFDPKKGRVELDLGFVSCRPADPFAWQYPSKTVGQKEVAEVVPLQLILKSA
jgi:hypothetical protein